MIEGAKKKKNHLSTVLSTPAHIKRYIRLYGDYSTYKRVFIDNLWWNCYSIRRGDYQSGGLLRRPLHTHQRSIMWSNLECNSSSIYPKRMRHISFVSKFLKRGRAALLWCVSALYSLQKVQRSITDLWSPRAFLSKSIEAPCFFWKEEWKPYVLDISIRKKGKPKASWDLKQLLRDSSYTYCIKSDFI